MYGVLVITALKWWNLSQSVDFEFVLFVDNAAKFFWPIRDHIKGVPL